ncbi:zinc ribbon domain-containing protein [Salinibacter altiplanensis]|uniref:zinc ribbon domain-containing protein n=1 Tax=Salinibacter altiplanensis TaxID=1803181 RepID=UPI000C9FC272|nr:zinc ribbon domain-containing protein [Salinibacter altiplanensis]
MSDSTRPCPSCGARVPASSNRCDLCGTAVDESGAEAEADGAEAEATETETDRAQETSSDFDSTDAEPDEQPSVFCNQCGWENPPGARFCSQCGEELQDLSGANAPDGTRPITADLPTNASEGTSNESPAPNGPSSPEEAERAMGRQIAMLVGGALALVVGLFFATQWSAQYEWGGEASEGASSAPAGNEASPSGAAGGSPPMQSGERRTGEELTDLQTLLEETGTSSVGGAMAGQIDSLETAIEQASGSGKRAAQSELVNLLIGVGQPGRAAVVQNDIADATGAADAQRRAADLLYRWMQQLQREEQRQQVLEVARHAAQAYRTVVDQRPDDLDARTRMGEAYLLTNRPMRGIKAINAVLDDDSTFVPARFQKGLALLQINRLDQATAAFEQVKEFAGEGSPFTRQADQALKIIEKQRRQSSSGTSSESGGAGAP